ncbi:MAG: hypothetical protein AB7I30_01480 [Isosphaeraceae bacterium]
MSEATLTAPRPSAVDHPTSRPSSRIASLDEFRGYTVAGMLLVNFLGGFAVVPALLKHHNTYCSYADTIMPQFFFAVGFAYRLTFLRRRDLVGAWAASWAVARRCAGLVLLGFALYHLDGGAKTWEELKAMGPSGFLATAFQRNLFQTLVHIALASLLVLPVIGRGAAARLAFMAGVSALHVGLSWAFYYDWVMARPGIDGGPLGFLTWTIPLLTGSLAHDAVARRGVKAFGALLAGGILMMALGYGLSCLGVAGHLAAPPFSPPDAPVSLWTMSQRTGSLSYHAFSSGFSLAVYAPFLVACDGFGLGLGLFRTFGRNALAAYVLHSIVAGAVKPWAPKDAPGLYVAAVFTLYFTISYLFVRSLEKNHVFIKL